MHWLEEGQCNTSFHKSTIQHRANNQISLLRMESGTTVETHEDIEYELLNYFSNILHDLPIQYKEAINQITTNIPHLVNADHNAALMRLVTESEVLDTLTRIANNKALGLCDFIVYFFKRCWHFQGREIHDIVGESKSTISILQAFNSTFLALIPKENNVTSPGKYRPIPLCNIIYKIITKIIANRLKPLLPFLISLEQSSYVEGRKILDGIILSHETIQSLKTLRKLGMLLKMDISKAFDKLSRDYFESTLKAFWICTH